MPPAVAAAAITAAATLGGSALSSRSSNRASKLQSDSTNRALDFEREREASRRSEYDRSMADYRRQWDAWNAMRMGLMQRYGGGRLNLGNLSGFGSQQPSLTPRRRMTLGDF